MPIRNWGGGGDHSDTFLSLQDEFIRRAQAAMEEKKAAAARRSGSGGSGGGGGGRSSSAGSSQYVNDGAGAIVNGMSTGATNWRNLYAFYKDQLKNTPRNSTVRRQVERQIANIEAVAESNGYSLVGGKVPSSVSEAEPGTNRYDKDQPIDSNVEAAINDQILYLMATRNGVYPGNERPLESYQGRMMYEGTVKELRAGMIADAKLQENVLEDIKGGRTTVQDPVSGVYREVTPEFTLNLIYQYNENQLALAGLERGLGVDGAFDDRMSTWETGQQNLIAPIISTRVFPAMDDNGKPLEPDVDGIRGYMDNRMIQFNVLKNLALQSSDPEDMIRNLSRAGRGLKSSMADMQTFIQNMPEGFEVEEYITRDIDYSMQLSEFLTSIPNMTFEEAAEAGAELVAAHPGEGYFLSQGDVLDILGNREEEVGTIPGQSIDDRIAGLSGSNVDARRSPGYSGALGALTARDGLLANKAVRNLEEPAIGVERYVYVSGFGESAPVAVPESQAAAYLASISGNPLFEDGGLSSGAFPSVEKIRLSNGRTETTVVWREMQAPSDEDVMWYAKTDKRTGNVTWATEAEYAKFGESPELAAKAEFAKVPFAGLENLLMVTGQGGDRYYVSSVTGQAYAAPPLTMNPGFDFLPTDFINEDGTVNEEYGETRDNGMLFLRGAGVDIRSAQKVAGSAIVSDEIDINHYRWLNENGAPVSAPTFAQVQAMWDKESNVKWENYQNDTRIRGTGERSKQFYREASREAATQRMRRTEFYANGGTWDRITPMDSKFEANIDTANEAARLKTGIHFGSEGQKNPRTFKESPPPIVKPVIPPVTIDQFPQRQRPPDDMGTPKPAYTPPARVKPPSTTKKKKSTGYIPK